jgi:hypothetical protein
MDIWNYGKLNKINPNLLFWQIVDQLTHKILWSYFSAAGGLSGALLLAIKYGDFFQGYYLSPLKIIYVSEKLSSVIWVKNSFDPHQPYSGYMLKSSLFTVLYCAVLGLCLWVYAEEIRSVYFILCLARRWRVCLRTKTTNLNTRSSSQNLRRLSTLQHLMSPAKCFIPGGGVIMNF